jgi:transcriptional regulator with XRE-family HTH domain
MKSITEIAICDRIRQVRESHSLTRNDFAEITKTGKTVQPKDSIYIRSIEHYRHTPSYDFLITVKNHFNLKWDWLIEGTGTMWD